MTTIQCRWRYLRIGNFKCKSMAWAASDSLHVLAKDKNTHKTMMG